MKKLKIQFVLSVNSTYIEQRFRQKKIDLWNARKGESDVTEFQILEGTPNGLCDVTFLFFSLSRGMNLFVGTVVRCRICRQEELYFLFFHLFKIRGAIRKTADYHLWVNQPLHALLFFQDQKIALKQIPEICQILLKLTKIGPKLRCFVPKLELIDI